MKTRRSQIASLTLGLATTAVAAASLSLPSIHAATITVNSLQDSGPGSLRAALAAAADGDTIDATTLSGPIKLTKGELVIDKNVTIRGPGPDKLAVDGNGRSRVFHVMNSAVASISGLAITNGITNPLNAENSRGGGIFNDRGSPFSIKPDLTVSNCTISANTSGIGGGGGIFNSGFLTVIGCTLSDNEGDGGDGGAICNLGLSGAAEHAATVTVIASTLSSNLALGRGGAIFNCQGVAYVITSTLSGNFARIGGGIHNGGIANLFVSACTLTSNSVAQSNLGLFGGIFNSNAFLEIGDTILNDDVRNIHKISGTVISDGYNLSSDSGDGNLIATGDQINTKPLLGPLQDNGGLTRTHKLLAGSPAIDKGKRASVFFLALDVDQRGLSRPADFGTIADAPGGDGSDIGAYEVQTTAKLAADLMGSVERLPILDGFKNALAVKVQDTQNALDINDTVVAGATLQAFNNQCNAQKGKKLTVPQATDLIEQATQIRTLLGFDRHLFLGESQVSGDSAAQE